MKYFDTFTGIGGFTKGIQDILPDAECVGFSEIDKYASQIYAKHYSHHKNYGDITKINTADLPYFDLLVGGFPCQAFSVAGKRRGFDDTRGTLFFELARILKDKRPRHFIFENVKGLLSHDGGKTLQTIFEVLTDLGYEFQWQVLNSKNFGVPQNRERIYIVGHLRGERKPKVFPIIKSGQVRNKPDAAKKEIYAGTLTRRYPASWNGNYVKNKKGIRHLTPVECERLQGFPDNWTHCVSDSERYKCCGNAVTVNVVRAIITRLGYGTQSANN